MGNYKFTGLFIGWMIVITASSLFSFPDDGGEGWFTFAHTDKVVHMAFHFGIVVLGILALNEKFFTAWSWNKKWVSVLLFSIGYGLGIEFLQWAMPFERTAEIWDVFANLGGAVLGVLLTQMSRSLIERLK